MSYSYGIVIIITEYLNLIKRGGTISRTRRIYNKDPNKHHLYARSDMLVSSDCLVMPMWENIGGWCYHPWQQMCMGNCNWCKDPTVSKRRRLEYKRRMLLEIRNEAKKSEEPQFLSCELMDYYYWEDWWRTVWKQEK